MRPLLKYCGNKSEQDFQRTVTSKADFLGFVFVPGVRREVQPSQVKQWIDSGPSHSKKLVALFVNPSLEQINHVAKELPIDIIQCHGTESPAFVAEVKKQTGLLVWKAIHHQENALEQMQAFAGIVDAYIIDAKVEGQWGGTGTTFDWDAIPTYIKEGKKQQALVFIAGGVDAKNVHQLVSFHPDGIDLSSGIEQNGDKSVEAILQFEGAVQT